ncbi:flagellar protein [Brevibacillus sp. SYP-B805]|uniref:TIGR02530 family flagellar biosynthesis protein n=1 Tax=Brevibacillus sp. SYP-B805 TaxID=1578199 RepID=UPI0013EC2AD6|nr:TIGR02530 family flagellar biosynthesis protein [Brevibacillus sp. SYP-B805]NGQ94012.1 flagellar protein [Brevibacillus sp. SYP-B805]
MNQSFRVGQAYFPPKPHHAAKPQASPTVRKPFQQWLTETVQADKEHRPLTFSQHALNRLQERGIALAPADVTRLEQAVQKAADKGAKESLVMMDNVAYVISIVNRKVITAVDEGHMKENVFTNIDSAIFV